MPTLHSASRSEEGSRAERLERLALRALWLAVGLVPATVLAVARFAVHPDPAGHGTHTQLGLPPCGFLQSTGLPCAGCGMTTAFAHMARGEVVAAAMANPAGVAFFLVAALMVPLGLWGAWRAAPFFDTLDRFRVDRVLMALTVVAVVSWVARLAAILL